MAVMGDRERDAPLCSEYQCAVSLALTARFAATAENISNCRESNASAVNQCGWLKRQSSSDAVTHARVAAGRHDGQPRVDDHLRLVEVSAGTRAGGQAWGPHQVVPVRHKVKPVTGGPSVALPTPCPAHACQNAVTVELVHAAVQDNSCACHLPPAWRAALGVDGGRASPVHELGQLVALQ
jgi:hypothetical protein